jgi:hypothetical protein
MPMVVICGCCIRKVKAILKSGVKVCAECDLIPVGAEDVPK